MENGEVSLLVGDRKVIAAGVAITESNLTIQLPDGGLKVIVEFEGFSGPIKIDATQDDPSTVRLKLHNFNDTGLDEAFGELNGEPLIIALWASVKSGTSTHTGEPRHIRTVTYTISVGHGWHG